ncbi:MAG: hypothetical protein NC485_10245 [Ruminococcus flavefaciens]|nr:hypothetical protein [Ruminococcus flavefaciens]MCM1059277.1 hypothetical protein [Eubacterium sp.]
MKINIAHLIKCCFVLSTVLLCSCSNNKTISTNSDISVTSADFQIQSTSQSNIEDITETSDISDVEVMHINEQVKYISDYTELNADKWDCAKLRLECFSGNDLFLTYSNNDMLEIYKINTENNDNKLIGTCNWSVMYGFLSTVIGNRYFVIMPSKAVLNGLKSTLYVYDIHSDEFYSADTFLAYNMVQYITNISDNKIAYYYYENKSKDWVIKEYDFITKISKELYHNNSDEDKRFSPVGLTYNGENLVLAVQYYNNELVTETKFIEIDMQGNKVQENRLNDFPIAIGYELNFDGKYYNVCGNKYRATIELSSMVIDLQANSFDTILPLSADLTVPTNLNNNRQLCINIIQCNKNDFALIDTNRNNLTYFNIEVPDYNDIHSSVSNENNDLAVIKCDENYNNFKLIIVKNSAICDSSFEDN